MAWIKMLSSVSGYRHDDRPWPPGGVAFEVPDWEAADLIRGQNAIACDPPEPVPEPVPVPAAEVVYAPDPVPVPEQPPGILAGPSPAGGPPPPPPEPADLDSGAVVTETEIAPPPVKAPRPSASQQAWVDYAVQVHGADVHAAKAMTKIDLMSRYGGRL